MAQGAASGVAYVAAAMALSVCLGMRLPGIGAAPATDLRKLVRLLPSHQLSEDVRAECLQPVEESQRLQPGDWIAIWGGSSTSALFLSQVARMAGLRVVMVVDVAKHGARLIAMGWRYLVDSRNPDRAVDIIRGITGGALRYGVDTVGRDTALILSRGLVCQANTSSHLVALAALPKQQAHGVVYHPVPMKLFHEVPSVGRALMAWLELALEESAVVLPEVTYASGGLGGVNTALDLMREGIISGRRIMVPI